MKLSTVKRQAVFILVNHVYVGTRCYEKKRKLLNTIGFSLGEGTRVVGPIHCTALLTVGENCWLGAGLEIYGNGSVVIGDNCDIGPKVVFLTGSHEIGNQHRRAGIGKNEEIRIGSGCWIGGRATLLGGIQVGEGSVLGACSCAVKDIPENRLCCGVPAREVRKLHE